MYSSNDVITISGLFANSAGVLTDPTDLVLVIKPHLGTAITVSYNPGDIVRDSAGAFHYDWIASTVTRAIIYFVQWQPTGAVQRASVPEMILVQPLLA